MLLQWLVSRNREQLACEQELLLGDFVKSTLHSFAASSHVLEWLVSLAQIEELACRLKRNLEGPLTKKKHFVS